MGKVEGKVCSQEGQRSSSNECRCQEEVVCVNEGALGREAKGESIIESQNVAIRRLVEEDLPLSIPQEGNNHDVFFVLRKTREWRHEWSVCSSRAFVSRAGTDVDVFGPPRQTVRSVPDENRTNKIASRRDGAIIGAVFKVKKKIPASYAQQKSRKATTALYSHCICLRYVLCVRIRKYRLLIRALQISIPAGI